MIKPKFTKQSNVKAQFQNSESTTQDAVAAFLAAGGVIEQVKNQAEPKVMTAK
jgi:hypothetical protein